jgi:membrane associated rhomboid family serine protease
MGLYDRDYLQDDDTPRPPMIGPATRMMVTNLVILNAAVFLATAFLGEEPGTGRSRVVQWLALTPLDLRMPWMWWKLLTCGFVHAPLDIGHVFWNMFGLWIFGRSVEERYGRSEFLRFYLTAIVLGSLAWAIRWNLSGLDSESLGRVYAYGASGGVTATILLFVFNFPRRTILLMFVLPVPAWILGLIVILGDVSGVMGSGDTNVGYDVHLVGAAFAGAYFWFGWNLGAWMPSAWRDGFRWPRFRRRPKLRLHDPEAKVRRDEEEADRILAKISREGLDSLTAKERRFMDDHSRRVRKRRGQ